MVGVVVVGVVMVAIKKYLLLIINGNMEDKDIISRLGKTWQEIVQCRLYYSDGSHYHCDNHNQHY